MAKGNTRKQIAEYESFILNVPNRLEKAKLLLYRFQLNYDSEEFERMKELYVENFKSPIKLNLTGEELAFVFWTYVGEYFVFQKNGKWIIEDDNAYETYGKPMIRYEDSDNKGCWNHLCPWVWQVRLENWGLDGLK